MSRVYWGDIHNHNEIGYAEGSLERSFRIAENSLDFYSFTPHGWWTDVPKNDEKIRKHHEAGFSKVKARWDEVRRTIAERNVPGSFITFPGWEWHSLEWGDHCIYFPDDSAELLYADTLDELKRLAREAGAILLPHHPGYRLGWRGLDWSTLEPDVSPVVEIFSEHGNSLEPASPWGMYNHSMGGIDRNQAGLEQIRRGRRFGFVASGDDHFGYPGAYGQGLTAAIAEKLTRPEIFSAFKARHTYAVTGDRIKADFRVNGGIMGDTVEAHGGAEIEFSVEARDRIRLVEIFRNGGVWKRFGREQPGSPGATHEGDLVRIEWGWDLLSSELVTTWDLRVAVDGGEIADLQPSFCGGAGSVEEVNLLDARSERSFEVHSYTSRRNTRPTSSVSLLWQADPAASITVEIAGRNGDTGFSRKLVARKSELESSDAYVSAFDRFSSPKLKIHSRIPCEERCMRAAIRDDEASAGDSYLLKVEQENGQMAWCSPIWIDGGSR